MADNIVKPYTTSAPAQRALIVTLDRVYGPQSAPGLSPTYPLLKALYFGTSGNVNFMDAHGDATVITVVAGTVLPCQSQGVLTTSTTVTAGSIIGLYE